MSLALGTVVRAGYCCYVRADQILISPLRSPGSLTVSFPGKGVVVHGQDEEEPGIAGARRCRPEVTDEPVQVISRAAAIDVAKASGMVCMRLPHESRAGRRVQKVWEVTATFASVVELMDHLRCQGVERLVLESTSDYWRIWLRRNSGISGVTAPPPLGAG